MKCQRVHDESKTLLFRPSKSPKLLDYKVFEPVNFTVRQSSTTSDYSSHCENKTISTSIRNGKRWFHHFMNVDIIRMRAIGCGKETKMLTKRSRAPGIEPGSPE